MSQPPQPDAPPQWRRPAGVAAGTWDYVHQRTIADRYDAFVADTPLCRLDMEQLAQWLPRQNGDRSERLLDLGCGSGRTAVPLAAAGFDVIGIDLSRPMLATAQRKVPQLPAGSGRLDLVQANLVELGCFESDIADHAVCLFSTLGMIQGRVHRREMLSQVARIVRPGGRFVLHVHNRWAALREPAGVRRLVGSWFGSLVRGDAEFGDFTYAYRGIEKMYMHRFSRRELLRDLTSTGWRVREVCALSLDGTHRIDGRWWSGSVPGGFLVLAVVD